jgi:hypothetical protein
MMPAMSDIAGAREPTALTVLGAGYVGLPTAVCLAALGHSVVCCDIDASKIESLAHGVATVSEDGLQELLDDGISSGRLRFVVDSAEAVEAADTVFLCLPTPQLEDGSVDVSILEAAVHRIGSRLKSGAVVVIKSTVPMGQAQKIREILRRDDVEVVSNPEFLREGGQGVREVPVCEEEVHSLIVVISDVVDEIDDPGDVIGREPVVHVVDKGGIVHKAVTVGATDDCPFGNDNGLVVCLGEGGEPVESFGVSQVFVEDSL